MLHWNGKTWQTVAKNAADYPFAHALTYDGHGGLWLTALSSGASSTEYIVHYTGGRWTQQALPAFTGYAGASVGTLALIPGTESLWGLGGLTPNGGGIGENAIFKYGP
ncbi:MAG: hypothetical protein ABSA93_07625 [Streptosporangiaceae bacterium]